MWTQTILHSHWGPMRGEHWAWMSESMGVWGWIAMLLTMVFWLALLVLVVAAAYWMVKKASRDEGDDAEQILRERYARGDIDEDEFVERKANL